MLTRDERRNVNKVGAKIYETALRRFLADQKEKSKYKKVKPGTEHLADTVTYEIAGDGHYEIGFSKKGKKAYIARFLNDGWRPRNQYSGPYGVAPKDPAWKDFIARIGLENDEEMGQKMAKKAKSYIDKTMRGQ